MQPKKRELSAQQITILLIFGLLLVLMPFFIVAVLIASDPSSQAAEAPDPEEVIFSNITANSAVVSFTTAEPVTASVSAQSSGASIVSGSDNRDTGSQSERLLHYIQLTGLSPESEYTITILVNGEAKEDSSWKLNTVAVNDQISTPSPVFGQLTQTGEAVVYAMIGDTSGNTSVASALVNESNGTFTLDRNSMLASNGEPLESAQLDGKDILVYANALSAGKVKLQYGADTASLGDLELSDQNFSFSANETITPGANPAPDQGDLDELPTTGDFTTDNFNESLLTETFSSGAEAEHPVAPYDIFISNVNSSGFTVNWRTKQPTKGYIEVLEGSNRSRVIDARDGNINNLSARYTHSATAGSGAIPAGTEFEFEIIVDGIRWGSNVSEIAREYADQFVEFVEINEGENSDEAGSSDSASTQTGSSSVSGSSTASSASESFSFDQTDLDITSFRVIIPPAPDSPPLPVVQSGSLTQELDLRSLEAQISAQLGVELDLARDGLVAARSSDGQWTSATINSNDGFSLSLGSTLNTDKDGFITVSDGDQLEIIAFSSANQFLATNQAYSETEIAITTSVPVTLTGTRHNSVTQDPDLSGFAAPGSTVTIAVNGVAGETVASSSGSWEFFTADLLIGQNSVTVESNGNQTTTNFYLKVPELPVTSLDSDAILFILGILLLSLGVILWRMYAQKSAQFVSKSEY